MRKRIFALALSAMLLLAVLVSCTDGGGSSSAPGSSSGGTQSASQSGTGSTPPQEIVDIVWQWPTFGQPGSGIGAVEDALNAMMGPDIGVNVTLLPVNIQDLLNSTIMSVSSGEQLDICMQLFTGVAPLVNNGLVLPLDEYMEEHGAAILEVCGPALYGASFRDELYGVPPVYIYGESYGYIGRKDIFDKYNITPDPDKLYTMEEMGELFATIKAGEGDDFFMMVPGTTLDASGMSFAHTEYDMLGATSASGVLMLNRSFTDMTIYNLFETQEYADFAALMYDFAQKGYISADASTNQEDGAALMVGGHYLGQFSWSTPNNEPTLESVTNMDLVTFNMIPAFAMSGTAGVSWSVCVNTVDAAKAVETINYIYAHPEAATILQFGLEGQDYEVVEQNEDGTLIRSLYEDPTTQPYYMPFGIYGNRFLWPVQEPTPIDMYKRLQEWNADLPDSRRAPAVGYVFDSSAVSAELAAVNAVIAQYGIGIACGTLPPDQVLPELNQALKDAGIETIIAENQRQLDAWAAENGK